MLLYITRQTYLDKPLMACHQVYLMTKMFKGFCFVALLCSLISCSPIGDYENELEAVEFKIQEKAYHSELERAIEHIKTLSTNEAYQKLVTDGELKIIHDAGEALIEAIHVAATSLRTIEDDNTDGAELRAKKAYESMNHHLSRFNSYKLTTTRDYIFYADLAKDMRAKSAEIEAQYDVFNAASFILLNRIKKAKEDHPNKVERLNSFRDHILNLDHDYQSLLSFLSEETTNRAPDDFRRYLKTYQTKKIKTSFPLKLVKDYENMIFQLSKSFSKILVDMSEYHAVAVSMVSWDDWYDFPTEHTVNFPMVELTYPTYLKAIEEYRSESREYSEYSIKNSALLDVITGGKITTSFHSGDDTANIWIEDFDSEYTQSFIIIENGLTTEVEESVSRDVYLKHINDKGKEVLSKPFGYFEDEVIDFAQPPGAAMVGNSEYGRWNTEADTGIELWAWFPLYSTYGALSAQRYDRNYHNKHSQKIKTYTPPFKRKGTSTTSYGVASKNSMLQKSRQASRSSRSNLKGAGSSFRNKGPSNGK